MKRGLLFSLAILALALAGPWLAPRSATEALDPAALRLLPPASRITAFVGREGKLLPAAGEDPEHPGRRRFEWTVAAGKLTYWRGPRQVEVPLDRLQLDPQGAPVQKTLFFLCGTDIFGRDLLSRMLAGAQVSLVVGAGGVLLAGLLGTLLGLLAGTGGRWADWALAQAGDATLSLPRILLVALLSAFFRPGAAGLALLLGLTGWPAFARLAAAEARTLTRSSLALAARAAGCSRWRVAWRHLLPHAAGPLAIAAGLRVGPFVLLEASLSFLGFGIAPPSPSWGNILAEGREAIFEGWWVMAGPGLLLGATVLILNAAVDAFEPAAGTERPSPKG